MSRTFLALWSFTLLGANEPTKPYLEFGGSRTSLPFSPRVIALSPNGDWLACTSGDDGVLVVDTITGKSKWQLECPFQRSLSDASINHLRFSGDGSVISAYTRNSRNDWDVRHGNRISGATFRGDASARLFADSEDGKVRATGCYDEGTDVPAIRLWDSKSDRTTNLDGIHTARTYVALSPNGNWLSTWGSSRSPDPLNRHGNEHVIQIWDVVKRELRTNIEFPHNHIMHVVDFSEDSQFLMLQGYHTLFVLSTSTWETLFEIPLAKSAVRVQVEPKERTCIVLTADGTVSRWKWPTGEPIDSIPSPAIPGHHLTGTLRPDGSFRVVTVVERALVTWNVRWGENPNVIRLNHASNEHSPIRKVAFSADGRRIVSINHDHVIDIRDRTGRTVTPPFAVRSSIQEVSSDSPDLSDLSFDPSGRTMTFREARSRFWRFRITGNGSAVQRLPRRWIPHFRCAYSNDHAWLATMTYDGRISIWKWDAERNERMGGWDVPIHSQCFKSKPLLISPNGRQIFAGFDDPTDPNLPMKLYCLETITGEVRILQTSHPANHADLTFSPNGRWLIESSSTHLAVYDTRSLTLLTRNEISALSVPRNLTHSPSGRLIARMLPDGVEVREFSSLEIRQRLVNTGRELNTFAISPDDRWLVGGRKDGSLVLWKIGSDIALERLDIPQRDRLWTDLEGQDAEVAADAIDSFASMPVVAMDMIRERIPPVAFRFATPADLDQWIRQLDDAKYAIRERAMKQLKLQASHAIPAMRLALENSNALEQRHRLQRLLNETVQPQSLSDSTLPLRALEILERIGEPAKELLTEFANGPPDAIVTLEAKRILRRSP